MPDRLREVVPGEDILVWREALYEGPISVAFTDPATREARPALFTEKGVPEGLFRRYTEEQETVLERYREHDEVVLWFEHDLFDQTLLIYLLQWLAARERGAVSINLVCIDSFPGVHPFKGLGQSSTKRRLHCMVPGKR